MKYEGYTCGSFAEWKRIMQEQLRTAKRFAIHCWEDEQQWHDLALKYGTAQETDWSGTVVEGTVTEEFCNMLLSAEEPEDKEAYNKFTPFFSIFLDNGFSCEHYGTELNN